MLHRTLGSTLAQKKQHIEHMQKSHRPAKLHVIRQKSKNIPKGYQKPKI